MVEIIPDDMPSWMKEAMDDGQLFNKVIERVAVLEADNAALTRLCKQMKDNRNTDI